MSFAFGHRSLSRQDRILPTTASLGYDRLGDLVPIILLALLSLPTLQRLAGGDVDACCSGSGWAWRGLRWCCCWSAARLAYEPGLRR